MAGILAATISSSDSTADRGVGLCEEYLSGAAPQKASDREVLNISRITLLLIAVVAMIIALMRTASSYHRKLCLGRFGATFGPLMLFSLFWKRTTRAGAIAGMLGGAGMVFVWNLLVRPLGGIWDIYELLPGVYLLLPCASWWCRCYQRNRRRRSRENLKKYR